MTSELLYSAVDTLRCIAAMGRKAGSETAKNWLLSHGFALEEGGYIPGKGFEEPIADGDRSSKPSHRPGGGSAAK